MDEYFTKGVFEQKVQQLYALIGDFVKDDPTAFRTYEEDLTAVSTLVKLGDLCVLSVQGQLKAQSLRLPKDSELTLRSSYRRGALIYLIWGAWVAEGAAIQ